MLDQVTRAVLEHEEVLKYLRGVDGEGASEARARIYTYLEELRTTQRYSFYRALQHPLYPILRKIDRIPEHLHHVLDTIGSHRIVYASNHKSHTDSIVELLVLEDQRVPPPLITAGINMFGGPLGLLHRHVTGAIPIRRNLKDPVYLSTLKAYVAEVLKQHDLFVYPEGGRSYSGELKPAKTGMFRAALTSGRRDLVIIPTAIAYDLVLEDHVLARQGVKGRQRPFGRELAEMVRYAVGYRSRAFVTFGAPVEAGHIDANSGSDVLDLARDVRARIGALYKVLPTAVLASAMRPSIAKADLEDRIDRLLDELAARHANLAVTSGRQAIDEAAEPLATRGIIVLDRGRFRVRDRRVLRYYAKTIEHLLVTDGRPH
jgi:glycerol-3-phosphate O-acyltransferase